MSMSKKDYVAIAERLQAVRLAHPEQDGVIDAVVDGLCETFAADNAQFREELFRKASRGRVVEVKAKHVAGYERLKNREGGLDTLIARIDANDARRAKAKRDKRRIARLLDA